MRGWFFSMPRMMRSAAAGVVFATESKRSIDCARRALSVTPVPSRELRTILVETPPGMHDGTSNGTCSHLQFVPQAFRKAGIAVPVHLIDLFPPRATS